MFCPKCGKKTRMLGLCRECFLKENPIKIKDFSVPMCRCGRYFTQANWNQGIEKALEKFVRENLVVNPEIEIKDIRVEPTLDEKMIRLKVTVTGIYRGEEFQEEILKDVKKEQRTCPFCGRVTSSYYEAILQFRVPVDAKKVLNGEYVARTEKVPGGFDAYITSAAYARKLGKEFSKKGFIVKKTAKLVGKKNGEDLYRTFIAIKSPGPSEGDFIRYKGRIFEVIEFGKTIRTRDLAQRKTLMIPPSQIQGAEIAAKKDQARRAMVSAVAPDHVQLMDMESYGMLDVPGSYPDLKEKEEVRYVIIKDKTYILSR